VSPVTLSKPVQKGNSLQKRYLELDKDPDLFCAELNRSLLKKADALGVNIAPVDFTNTFCKHAWVSLYGGKILSYRGDFTLKGDADSLLFALHAGIGERSSSGFGAIVPEGRR
jgi:CRISPR-associated endoribonuclease Cas6